MRLLNQRDTYWKNDKLGTSNVTIGSHGCTVTCLAMLSEYENVGELNRQFTQHGVYAQGNLVIWTNVSRVLSSLEFVYRYYKYDNAKVKEYVDNGTPVLVEVDGTPIGGTRHWVLYIGNGVLIDPWDAIKKPTSVYKPIGFALFKLKVDKPTMNTQDQKDIESMKKLRKHNAKYKDAVAILKILGIKDKAIKDMGKELTLDEKTIEKMKIAHVAELAKEALEWEKKMKTMKKEWEIDLTKVKDDYKKELEEIKDNAVEVEVKVETSLQERYHKKGKKIKLLAVLEILSA